MIRRRLETQTDSLGSIVNHMYLRGIYTFLS